MKDTASLALTPVPDDSLDPLHALHAQEAALLPDPSRLSVSKEALWLNIRSVFSLPAGRDSEKLGTFLYRKLGRLGLVLHLQVLFTTSRGYRRFRCKS